MEDEVFEAEIMPESGNYVLNITLAATFSVSIIFLMLGTSIGQILDEKPVEETSQNWWEVPLQDRSSMTNLGFEEGRSVLPVKGTYDVLTYTEHFIEVELPLSEEDAGFPEDDLMHVAIWRPINSEHNNRIRCFPSCLGCCNFLSFGFRINHILFPISTWFTSFDIGSFGKQDS